MATSSATAISRARMRCPNARGISVSRAKTGGGDFYVALADIRIVGYEGGLVVQRQQFREGEFKDVECIDEDKLFDSIDDLCPECRDRLRKTFDMLRWRIPPRVKNIAAFTPRAIRDEDGNEVLI